MKVLVAYVSRTGNTKKVAEAILQEIEGEKEIKQLGEIENIEGYDIAFVGFPIEEYGPAGEAKNFLQKHCRGKKVALFTTHAAPEGFEPLQGWLANCKEAAAGAQLLGMFNCQGDLAESMRQAMLKHEDPKIRRWAELSVPKGNPDATRLERARVFARETMGGIV